MTRVSIDIVWDNAVMLLRNGDRCTNRSNRHLPHRIGTHGAWIEANLGIICQVQVSEQKCQVAAGPILFPALLYTFLDMTSISVRCTAKVRPSRHYLSAYCTSHIIWYWLDTEITNYVRQDETAFLLAAYSKHCTHDNEGLSLMRPGQIANEA